MTYRWLICVGALAVVSMCAWSSGDAIGHAQTAVTMTPWGEPDLQGV